MSLSMKFVRKLKQSVYNYFGDLDGIQLSAIKLYNELVISPEWSKYEKLNNFFDKLDLRLTTALEKKYLSDLKIKPINGCLFLCITLETFWIRKQKNILLL